MGFGKNLAIGVFALAFSVLNACLAYFTREFTLSIGLLAAAVSMVILSFSSLRGLSREGLAFSSITLGVLLGMQALEIGRTGVATMGLEPTRTIFQVFGFTGMVFLLVAGALALKGSYSLSATGMGFAVLFLFGIVPAIARDYGGVFGQTVYFVMFGGGSLLVLLAATILRYKRVRGS